MIAKMLFVLLLSIASSVGGALPWVYADLSDSVAAASDGTVNINTASQAELMKLKGIGKTVAERIIEYRQQNGPFESADEIQKVRGVGRRIWESNRKTIRVK